MPTSSSFVFVGVIHLGALPGGPRPSAGFAAVRERALRDAEAIVRGGAQAAIVENLGDAPFPAGPVAPHVLAAVAAIGSEVRAAFPSLELGVNLLRNDARGSLGVAAAIGAAFVRVNVHTGAMLTDQGILQGDAHGTLAYRQSLGASVRIAADILVKHAIPIGVPDIGTTAADTFRRGGADVLIVTGSATGAATDPSRFQAVREAVPEAPVWVGSGVTLGTARDWRAVAHGAIVGTALHIGSEIHAPVDVERVRRFRDLFSEG